MIVQINKGSHVFQAYKEIGITRNIIIDIYELINFKGFTSHKFIKSRGTSLRFHSLVENDIKLVNIARGIINKI
jgi:hypothetical protein